MNRITCKVMIGVAFVAGAIFLRLGFDGGVVASAVFGTLTALDYVDASVRDALRNDQQ